MNPVGSAQISNVSHCCKFLRANQTSKLKISFGANGNKTKSSTFNKARLGSFRRPMTLQASKEGRFVDENAFPTKDAESGAEKEDESEKDGEEGGAPAPVTAEGPTGAKPAELSDELTEELKRINEEKERQRLEAEELAKKGDQLYDLGRLAYERGAYSNAASALEQALEIISPNSVAGGEAQMWLAMAYEACGRNELVSEIYLRLEKGHPSPVIRKQAQDLRYIFEAPALKINENERVKIKTLSEVETFGSDYKPMIRQRSRKKIELTLEEKVLQNYTPPYVPNKYILVASVILATCLAVYVR